MEEVRKVNEFSGVCVFTLRQTNFLYLDKFPPTVLEIKLIVPLTFGIFCTNRK
jgi:hypothetical protein